MLPDCLLPGYLLPPPPAYLPAAAPPRPRPPTPPPPPPGAGLQAKERGLIQDGDRVVVSQCPRKNMRSDVMQESGVVKIITVQDTPQELQQAASLKMQRSYSQVGGGAGALGEGGGGGGSTQLTTAHRSSRPSGEPGLQAGASLQQAG